MNYDEFVAAGLVKRMPTAAVAPTQAIPDVQSRAKLETHYKEHPELLRRNPKQYKRTFGNHL
jgi:hypothetical protein